ncbi:MAG: type II toxin-antitoxin system VapC family toxin [Desulfobacula sp.]|uniref:type II toxin-antitoxin system VapC family toxin n=1 Tax=Desulfobacula sp. TaxID=2593537 RepID=UPI0025C6DEB7|nr:type II toxin-antitoxin system VapC family toxin [Desulfobacula sp.]MCD4722625.1 type II toxin-antitoxin system VapC family toxin [Desulfobacula sp.]
MDILLDTQVILWSISGDSRLSRQAGSVFLDPTNNLYFSIAGYWEIAIKISIGKLVLADRWSVIIDREMRGNFIKFLPITQKHCNSLTELPFYHRDPFDRMIVAQAKTEQMALLSADPQLKKYEIEVIW